MSDKTSTSEIYSAIIEILEDISPVDFKPTDVWEDILETDSEWRLFGKKLNKYLMFDIDSKDTKAFVTGNFVSVKSLVRYIKNVVDRRFGRV